MRLSGPVDSVEVDYKNRRWTLLSDRHNSTQGSCPGSCRDVNLESGNVEGKDSQCETILYFLQQKLEQGVDFFLEASFVLKDAERSKELDVDADYIDRILFLFHDSLLRKKNGKYPKSLLHYVDIRDFFLSTYNESGTREMISANPFSGSVIVKEFFLCNTKQECENCYRQGRQLLSFILEHAWDYFSAYLEIEASIPSPGYSGRIFDSFRDRLQKMRLLRTGFQGRMILRVGKQLLKLQETEARAIRLWARDRFSQELDNSMQMFQEWTSEMEQLFSSNLSEELFLGYFRTMQVGPINCLVALSSIVMDVYALARALYHQKTNETIFYCGSAHVENYLSFFLSNGGEITNKSVSSGTLERCTIRL